MDEKPKRSIVSSIARTIGVGFVFIVLYVLSMGPAARLCIMGDTIQPWITACETVYWPVVWTTEFTGDKWLEAYCTLWVDMDEFQKKVHAGSRQ